MALFKDVSMEDMKPEWMRLPLWRWQSASRFMADPVDDEYDFISDSYLREASIFMHARAASEPGFELQMMSNPALVNAIQIYHHTLQHGGARWQIEALILGGAPDEKLNEMFPSRGGPRTYRYYRKLFFDVDAYLENQHAILANIFGLTMTRHDSYSDHDLPWKMLGHALGWESFSDFLNHYVGGQGSRKMKQYLQEFQEMRMLYYGWTQTLDMRTAFQEKSLALFDLSLKHYNVSEEETNSILTMGALDSCRNVLDALHTTWQNVQPQSKFSALEPVRSGTRKLALTGKEVKELENVFDVEAIPVT